ncbi:MAG: hypothetical protein JXR95_06495 [Deltaproteobacteria bacterium]|nr:hypothetical protein [Deltaproteobacteria bacterium]
MAEENLRCTCGTKLMEENTYSYAGIPKCKTCFFEEGKDGPMQKQYKKCPSCSHNVHTFTIKCPKCGVLIHETGTITVRRTIKSSFVIAYGLILLILFVSAMVIPGYSDKGWVAWPMTIGGFALAGHGLLGLVFFLLPFGFKTLNNLSAFLLGLSETAIGLFLLILPQL